VRTWQATLESQLKAKRRYLGSGGVAKNAFCLRRLLCNDGFVVLLLTISQLLYTQAHVIGWKEERAKSDLFGRLRERRHASRLKRHELSVLVGACNNVRFRDDRNEPFTSEPF